MSDHLPVFAQFLLKINIQGTPMFESEECIPPEVLEINVKSKMQEEPEMGGVQSQVCLIF